MVKQCCQCLDSPHTPPGLTSLPWQTAASHPPQHSSSHSKITPPVFEVLSKDKGTLGSPWNRRRQHRHHTCFDTGDTARSPLQASHGCSGAGRLQGFSPGKCWRKHC